MALTKPLIHYSKLTPQTEATVNSEKFKAVAVAVIQIRLSEGISK